MFLTGLKKKKVKPAPVAPVADVPGYAPDYGAKVHGLEYQGGEQVPAHALSRLPAHERGHFHSDPAKAAESLQKYPALSKGQIEGDSAKGRAPVTPLAVGDTSQKKYNNYDVPPDMGHGHQSPESATAGRGRLPAALSSPELMTDEEAEHVTPKLARDCVDMFNRLDERGVEAAAKAGIAKRGWYKDAAHTLVSLFGEHTPRFVALLAATSPQVPVKRNLEFAASVWSKWTALQADLRKQGKPLPTMPELVQWLERNQKVASKKTKGLMDTTYNNIAAALLSDDPGSQIKAILSGPKVDSFRRNLLGNLMAATNDVWMSYISGFDQKEIGGKNVDNPYGMKTPKGNSASFKVLNGQYLANSIMLRRVAASLNAQQPPDAPRWTAAEVQETAWSFFRALAFVGGQSRTPKARKAGKQPLDPIAALNALTHEHVSGNADFVTLLFKKGKKDGTENPIISALRRAGLGPTLDGLFAEYQKRQQAQAEAKPRGSVLNALTPADREAIEPIARRAGKRVRGFMTGAAEFSRSGPRWRFAAGEQPPLPVPQTPVVAPPQAQNAAQQAPAAAGPPPIDEHREHLLAYSPNVDELSFEDALARSRSGNHKAFKKIVDHINEQVGLKAHLQDAIGDWSDGAENSILQRIDEPVGPETVDYLASWYGLLANQKSVLAFTPLHGGLDSVYQIELPQTDLGQIRKSLDAAGIAFRTLVPSKKGTNIVIYDENRGMRDQVAAWAGKHNATIRESIGKGRYIGGSTRTAARAAYRKNITAYEATAAKSGGSLRAYRPPVLPNHVRSGQAEGAGKVRNSRRGQPLRFATGPLGGQRRMPSPSFPDPEAQDTGFARPPEPAMHPRDIRTGLAFGLDDWSVGYLRRLYRAVKDVRTAAGKTARAAIRQVYRGDVAAAAPMFDAVADAGREDVVQELANEGFTWKDLTERLDRLGHRGGPALDNLQHRNNTLGADWQAQNEPLEALGADEAAAAPVTTFGEDVASAVKRGTSQAKRLAHTALTHLTNPVTLPKKLRGALHGSWEDYHTQHNLPREEAPGAEARQEAAVKNITPHRKDKPTPLVRMGRVQSPAGGVVVRGLYYPGGKYIPSANLEKASYPQYEHVEAQKAKFQREDGSMSVQGALESEGAAEATKFARGNYTPGVDPRVDKIRSALGRGGKAPPATKPVKAATGHIGSGLSHLRGR